MQIFTLVRSLSARTAAISRSAFVSGLLGLLGLGGPAHAQTTSWEAALSSTAQSTGGTSQVQATAINAAGEVLVSGFFTGQVTFGSTVLTNIPGSNGTVTPDLFVAKYLPATNAWAWAYQGGGTGADQSLGLAVSGNAVYVTGFITNDLSDGSGVTLTDSRSTPTTVRGASTNTRFNNDLLLARYTDNGSSAALDWVQVGGGTGNETGAAVAVSGSSVYVTGYIDNNLNDDDAVVFGSDGTATTTGLTTVRGTSATVSNDVVLAKYTDNVVNGGSGGSLQWVQVGGGIGNDRGLGVAVNGSSVYVTGYINNTLTDDNAVRFGSDGTATTATNLTTVRGTSTTTTGPSNTFFNDVLLIKYVDNATGRSSSGSLQWAQVGGGKGNDQCLAVAVNGSSVYVTGYVNNNLVDGNEVRFGSDGTATTITGLTTVRGTSASASNDFLLAKYADNTTSAALVWVQVGGGAGQDQGQAIAVNGRNVYVTGFIDNTSANGRNVFFGSDGTATTTTGLTPVPGASNSISNDLLLVRYTDYSYRVGSGLQWARVGGGTGIDRGQAVAVNGQLVYAAGRVTPPASFGNFAIAQPAGSQALVLARLTDNDPTPLPVQLLAFAATREGRGTARLTWATASEAKSQTFQVERSADGRQFAAIGTVAAAGNSSTRRNYELLDAELPTGAARLYYRLKQVDADGTFSYSPVRTVALTDAAAAPVLYPNPAHGGAAILTGAQPGAVVTVTDALGRPVAHATADAAGTAALVLPQGLATGLYVVHVGSKAVRLTVE